MPKRINEARGAMTWRALMATATLVFFGVDLAHTQRPAARPVQVTIRVALVDSTFDARPLALFPLEISAQGRRDTVRTTLVGVAEVRLLPGSYRLRSLEPATVGDSQFSWDIDLAIGAAGTPREVELTNTNARRVPATSSPPRVAAPVHEKLTAQQILARYGSAVVRIEAGLAHGTGFVVAEPEGAILTNDHVVSGQRRITVYLDSVTRVLATVVRRDRATDAAILKVAPELLATRPRLPLSIDEGSHRPVEPGMAVYALGYPLNQGLTLTTGIVSGIRSGAIISDVSINPGNSGGPMISADGMVIGLNTFRDPSPGGPGLGGAVLVSQLTSLLAQARAAFPETPDPPPRTLPVMPHSRIPASALNSLVAKADHRTAEKIYQEASAGNFTVLVSSPIARATLARAAEEYVASDRRRREVAADVENDERYDAGTTYQWQEHTGDDLLPVVQVMVIPKEGETGGSLFRRLMLGPNLQATWRFKGDVRDAQIFRDSVPIEPIRGGVRPLRRLENNVWVEMRDVASYAHFVLDARTFAPRQDGLPPVIVIGIDDLKRPGAKFCYALPPELTARIWNDFAPLASAIWPGEDLRSATLPERGRSKIDRRLVPAACREMGGGSWIY
jgi:S1-C subfamily serine protease